MRDDEISRLVATVARPIADAVIRRFARSGDVLTSQDAEDLIATVMLRLIVKLRAGAAIDSVSDYVATLTFNAVNDHFRSLHPARARLRNRLRYALGHDLRLARWTVNDQLAGGLARWRGAPHARGERVELSPSIAARARDIDRPAEALLAIFHEVGEPMLLRALIDTLAPLWQTIEMPSAVIDPVETETPLVRLESRELMRVLWREIAALRPLQRKTLLLNLRAAGAQHALGLFVLTGTATMEAIAEALEWTGGELAAIWSELPLDDLRIAAMLDLTRQQVINLRKSARERLTRRLAHLRSA